LLPSHAPEASLERARDYLRRGVRVFKLKVGPDQLLPVQRATLQALRNELGDAFELRLDANRSISRAALGETLRELARYRIEFLEEPLDDPQPDELAGSPCPLALDESLQRLHGAALDRLLELGSVQALVLKPTTLGGFGRCIRLALRGRQHGCWPVVSHTLEGPVGWAACAHLALALGSDRAAGLWPMPHQRAPLPSIAQGRLLASPDFGLGLAE
jgi:L-alanine-DL-glutamate epimerase-like enolase superfamily enzyme